MGTTKCRVCGTVLYSDESHCPKCRTARPKRRGRRTAGRPTILVRSFSAGSLILMTLLRLVWGPGRR